MKPLIALALMLSVTATLSAQNATLTKGETVEYLNRKFKEMEGLKIVGDNSQNYKFYKDCTVKLENSKLKVRYNLHFTVDNSWYMTKEISFNPLYIDALNLHNGTSYSAFYIWLSSQNCSINTWVLNSPNESETSDNAFFYIMKDNPDFVEKMKKAFLHLQALLKAEDDPF